MTLFYMDLIKKPDSSDYKMGSCDKVFNYLEIPVDDIIDFLPKSLRQIARTPYY